MKFGFPSSVKGIRPEARETAEEAARRAGLPLNEWLNAIILQQAAEQGIKTPFASHAGDNSYADDYSVVQRRLDDLTRRIDQVTRAGAAAYAPKRRREESDQLVSVIARLEHRLDQFAADTHSQRVNSSRPVPTARSQKLPRAGAPLNSEHAAGITVMFRPQRRATAGHQDLSGLEDQLRRITDQIETLRRPGVEEAINALRVELGEIGRTLNEAMPRRAIEIIEKQIQCLTRARSPKAARPASTAAPWPGIEHGLAEVRDALARSDAGGKPGRIHRRNRRRSPTRSISSWLQKDPSTMHQLESSIATLREMAAHVASNETVSSLAAQVQVLADKIDRLAIGGGTGDAINKLELRIDALSRALTERAHNGDALPPHLEALLQSLSDKIEQLQQSRGDNIALGSSRRPYRQVGRTVGRLGRAPQPSGSDRTGTG